MIGFLLGPSMRQSRVGGSGGLAPSNTVAPTTTGAAVLGSTLSGTDGTWAGDPTIVFTYLWRRDGVSIGVTTATYVTQAADVGHAVSRSVTGTNSAGSSSASSSNAITVTQMPANTVAPTTTGAAVLGSTLSGTDGTWTGSPAPTFTYLWKRDGVSIGVTTATYVTQAADVGHALGRTVTGTNAAGSVSANSSNAITVTQSPANTVAPTTTGTALLGSTLSGTDGTWTGSPSPTFTYLWKRDGVSIGVTTATYVTQAADVGHALGRTVTGTNAAGSVSANSSNAITVTQSPANTVTPVASPGGFAIGDVLSCTLGTWTGYPAPTLTRQWRRAGSDISGQTGATYTAVAADIGPAVDCVVTGDNGIGSPVAVDSNDLTSASLFAPLDFTTQSAGGGSVASYGLSFARASSGYSVRDDTSSLITTGTLTSNDVPRYGRRLGTDPVALLIEESRTNRHPNSRDPSGVNGTSAGTPIVTPGLANGPDGATLSAARIQCTSADARYKALTGQTANARVHSIWMRRQTGAGAGDWALRVTSPDTASGAVGGLPETWTRNSVSFVATVTAQNVYWMDGRNTSGVGGIAAGARDYLVDLAQTEEGKFATENIITTSAAVTRAGERLYDTTGSRWIDSNRLGLETALAPKGSSSQYGANMRLWTIDANNYAEIDATTRAVVVVIGGSSYTTAGTMTWASADLVEIWCAAGGGALASDVKYRVNGGGTTTLSTGSPPTQGTVTASGALDLLCNGTAAQFTARVRRLAGYRSGQKPTWA